MRSTEWYSCQPARLTFKVISFDFGAVMAGDKSLLNDNKSRWSQSEFHFRSRRVIQSTRLDIIYWMVLMSAVLVDFEIISLDFGVVPAGEKSLLNDNESRWSQSEFHFRSSRVNQSTRLDEIYRMVLLSAGLVDFEGHFSSFSHGNGRWQKSSQWQ